MRTRAHALYSGNVQGVGFRFTAERVARRLDVTGYVKNLSDGTVEVVCEGEESAVGSMLRGLETAMNGYISDSSIKWGKASGVYNGFGIKF